MDQDDVVKNLRSCLISCKGGIKLDNLRADYRTIAGEPLSFKQFGYSSLEDFIRNVPEVIVTRKNGELYVEATPSRTTAHLTKMVSRQKTRRKIRPQSKKWSPPRHTTYTKSFLPGAKNNNNYNGFQPTRSNYVNSPGSFTKSTPGKSNLYTDFSRPILPLMETVVQYPLINNEKSNFAPSTPPVSPIKRLTDNATNPSIASFNQSVSNYKTTEDLKCKVLNDKTAASSVINLKPKTAELRPLKPLKPLSERLKVSPPKNTPIIPRTPSPPIGSYNNGHTSSFIPSIFNKLQIMPRGQISDPRRDLQVCADTLNLPSPVYKMYSKKERHSAKMTIYASVKVGAHTFHTYPEDAASEEEAEKIAARLALVNLAKESSPEVTTVDKKLVKERILNIVTKHQSGVFMHLLPEYYCEQYKEALPHNWQRIIEECVDINQEKGVGDSMILCRASPTAKRSENNSILFKDFAENNFPLNEKIQLSPIGPASPGKLTVPKTTTWQVYITCVISTIEIWVRFGKNNDNFVKMRKEMTKHYDKKKSVSIPSAECIVGDFYAVLEDNYWHRVQCIDFDFETGLATVFFIDEGYDEQYKFDVLHPLDKKFCMLSVQATRVALQGLEEFRDYAQLVPEIENHLSVEQLFLAKVHSTKADEYGSYTTVTFYDTSKEDKDVDVNQILFDKMLRDIMNASNIQIGQLIGLYITHIDEYGKVYAQLNSFMRSLVSSETLSQILVNNTTTSLARETINFTKMYLAKWDSQWYRARVKDMPDNEVTVFLFDIGKTVTISKKDLFHMDETNALHYIPSQAMQIFLHHLDQSKYDGRLVARFRELVSDTDLLIARIIKKSPSGIPIVEIFKRIGPSNMLASINTSLIYDNELSKANEDGNNNVNKSTSTKKRLERRNSRAFESNKLNPPTISDVGQYFDVHVTLAAHPGHFIVQPLNDAGELKTMMIDLQKYCNSYNGPPLETIGEGKLYAGKFREDWYRVYVTNIISDNEVSVYFCDFGDVTIVSRTSLQPLKSDFLKLPYQAVKAKLVGIKAINNDWSVNDCVRFKDLVLDKDFVSVVAESVFDHLSPANGTVLGLRLIDVSTEKDIYIDRLLVEENRAKYIDGFENLPSS